MRKLKNYIFLIIFAAWIILPFWAFYEINRFHSANNMHEHLNNITEKKIVALTDIIEQLEDPE